jgi:hypothetical protein
MASLVESAELSLAVTLPLPVAMLPTPAVAKPPRLMHVFPKPSEVELLPIQEAPTALAGAENPPTPKSTVVAKRPPPATALTRSPRGLGSRVVATVCAPRPRLGGE